MKPIFLIGTQTNGLPVAINIDHIKCIVAFPPPEGPVTMVIMGDDAKVAITETVDEFVNSVNDV